MRIVGKDRQLFRNKDGQALRMKPSRTVGPQSREGMLHAHRLAPDRNFDQFLGVFEVAIS